MLDGVRISAASQHSCCRMESQISRWPIAPREGVSVAKIEMQLQIRWMRPDGVT